MITGYFDTDAGHPRPSIELNVRTPESDAGTIRVSFLLDTGADYTVLSPATGVRLRTVLGVDLLSLPFGPTLGGIGGEIATRRLQAAIARGNFVWRGEILLAEPPPGRFIEMPSILGWDVMRYLTLFMDYAADRVLLLEPGDAMPVSLPVP